MVTKGAIWSLVRLHFILLDMQHGHFRCFRSWRLRETLRRTRDASDISFAAIYLSFGPKSFSGIPIPRTLMMPLLVVS
jgi:hypothetical protein